MSSDLYENKMLSCYRTPLWKYDVITIQIGLIRFSFIFQQLFKGKFHHCTDIDEERLDNVITRKDCIQHGGKWTNKKYNFDNLFQVFAIRSFIIYDIM